jgi:pSer/pThr/pTyr-binding forkhead associated (FHA) protein
MRFSLTYLTLPYKGLSVDFDQKIVAIGRAPENDLVVEEPRVSGYHARIFTEEGQVFFEDIGSTNGSRVNGKRILRPLSIHSGDVIGLGSKVRIRYDILREAASDRTLTDPPDEEALPSDPSRQGSSSFPIWALVLMGILAVLLAGAIVVGGGALYRLFF